MQIQHKLVKTPVQKFFKHKHSRNSRVNHPRVYDTIEFDQDDNITLYRYSTGLNDSIDHMLNTHFSFEREDDSQDFYSKI